MATLLPWLSSARRMSNRVCRSFIGPWSSFQSILHFLLVFAICFSVEICIADHAKNFCTAQISHFAQKRIGAWPPWAAQWPMTVAWWKLTRNVGFQMFPILQSFHLFYFIFQISICFHHNLGSSKRKWQTYLPMSWMSLTTSEFFPRTSWPFFPPTELSEVAPPSARWRAASASAKRPWQRPWCAHPLPFGIR